ncbi:hypothetical protein ON010_g14649 [Phytophthora cinnamomi]|nr:hypothetical protein ON010_g14649 [Phytophthora cinnamomi]
MMSSHPTTQGSTVSSQYESAGSNKTLKILLGSEQLQGKRIPFDSIAFERALSKGASGEVWVCEYNGQKVAAKRLLQTKDQKAENVQAFAEEIRLSASLVHPHIVEFVGVAWNSLNNLVMVLEFFPKGNLQNYLQKHGDLLSWARDKIHMAIGVAQALEYLHARTPPLIHRDLKSNNVMLTDQLEPKLIDFGVSRDTIDLTMTAGVGTPYWTAPEILEGKRYTEQADIYSFGVVLTELDTCKIPYSNAATEGGGMPKPFQILQDVLADANSTLAATVSVDLRYVVMTTSSPFGVFQLQHETSKLHRCALAGTDPAIRHAQQLHHGRIRPSHHLLDPSRHRFRRHQDFPSPTSKDGSPSACDCSPPPTLVSATGIAAAEGSNSLAFAGTASDIAQWLYKFYEAGDEVDQIAREVVPGAVKSRLDNLSVNFEELPGLLQRAVLWDSGFALASGHRAVQVWTLDNRTMADIAISVDELNTAGCEALVCTDSNGEAVQIYETCRHGPVDVLAVSKCVVEVFESDGSSSSTVWATGGSSTVIPDIRVVKTVDMTSCGCNFTVYLIHTTASEDQPSATGECPAGQWAGSLVIPCFGNDTVPDSVRDRITTPKGSDWVTKWISEHRKLVPISHSSGAPSHASATTDVGKEGGSGISWWWLLIILLIILLVIIATIAACRHWHRLSRFNSPPDSSTYIFVGGRMWAVEDENHGRGAGYWLRLTNWSCTSQRMSAFAESKTLPSGYGIPVVALSVYRTSPGPETYNSELTALKIGYHHIDTATAYRNESDVVLRGLVGPMVGRTQTTVELPEVIDAVHESNQKLGLEYIDLYLLHAPCALATRAEAWRALEDMQAKDSCATLMCPISVNSTY